VIATGPVRRSVALTALVVVLVAALAGCAGQQGDAVDYSATELRSGEPVSLESFRGRPTVLVSWATWCRECDEELTALQAFAESDEAEDLAVVAVNLDAADVEAEIEAKIAKNGLDVTLWRDRRNDFKRSFGALGVPTTVLVDRDGKVAGTFPGGVDFEAEELRTALDDVRAGS
jgi:peroxiredoxin